MTYKHIALFDANFAVIGQRVQMTVSNLSQNIRQWNASKLFQAFHTRWPFGDFVVLAVDFDFNFVFMPMMLFSWALVRRWRFFYVVHNKCDAQLRAPSHQRWPRQTFRAFSIALADDVL